jgi:hypothetical protein
MLMRADLEGPLPHLAAASLHEVSCQHCGQVGRCFGLWIVLCLLCFVISSASPSLLFALLLVVHPALTNPFFLPSLHFLLVVGCCFPPSCGFLLGRGAPHTTFSIPWPRCSTWIFLGSFLVGAPEFFGPNLGALFFLLVADCCFPQSWGFFLGLLGAPHKRFVGSPPKTPSVPVPVPVSFSVLLSSSSPWCSTQNLLFVSSGKSLLAMFATILFALLYSLNFYPLDLSSCLLLFSPALFQSLIPCICLCLISSCCSFCLTFTRYSTK